MDPLNQSQTPQITVTSVDYMDNSFISVPVVAPWWRLQVSLMGLVLETVQTHRGRRTVAAVY